MADDKPVFIISDLHIGDGGPRDNFGCPGSERPDRLTAFLDHVEAAGGELIILGDLLEFWQAPVGDVIAHNRELLDRLGRMGAVYILGNHDSDLAGFVGTGLLRHDFFDAMLDVTPKPGRPGASPPYERRIGGKTFRLMHGHEVDPFNASPAPSWGRILSIFAGIFEEHNGSPRLAGGKLIESRLEWLGERLLGVWHWLTTWLWRMRGGSSAPGRQLTPAQKPSRAAEMLRRYRAHHERGHYDVLVVGHTHHPGRLGDWYLNAGCWARQIANFVRIDPDGRADVYDWDGRRATPNTDTLQEG